MYCIACGQQLEEHVKFCWKCGAKQQPEKSKKETLNLCPLCHKNDKVAKVSAIVSRQTHQLHGTTSEWIAEDDGGGRWSDVPFSGTQQSELAQKLSPPNQPDSKPIGLWYFLPILTYFALILMWFAPIPKRKKILLAVPTAFFIIWLIVFNVLDNIPREQLNNFSGEMFGVIFVFALIISIGAVIIIFYLGLNEERDRRKDYVETVEIPLWQEAMSKWEKLYYCFRDDCVFDPKTTKHVPAEMMNDLLDYRLANDSLAQ